MSGMASKHLALGLVIYLQDDGSHLCHDVRVLRDHRFVLGSQFLDADHRVGEVMLHIVGLGHVAVDNSPDPCSIMLCSLEFPVHEPDGAV